MTLASGRAAELWRRLDGPVKLLRGGGRSLDATVLVKAAPPC